MAGSSFSLFHNTGSVSPNKGLIFLFDFAEKPSEVRGIPNDSGSSFHHPFSGELFFVKNKRSWLLKSMAFAAAFFALSATLFYTINSGLETEYATGIDDTKKEIPSENVTPLAKDDILQKVPAIEKKAIAVKARPEPVKAKRKINHTEKTSDQKIVPQVSSNEGATVESPSPTVTVELSDTIQGFHATNFSEALRLSSKSGRYTFIKFGADWCTPCRLMENTALKDEKVVAVLETKFTIVNIDIENFDGIPLKTQFNVNRVPTLLILDANGYEVNRKEGALGASALYDFLKSASSLVDLDAATATGGFKDFRVKGDR